MTMLLGYVAAWADLAHVDVERAARQLTHLCVAFANIDASGDVALYVQDGERRIELDETQLRRFGAWRAFNPQLKVMLSIGGWTADGFSDAALTEESRSRFARSAVALMQRLEFDGLDIDWEYPGSDVAGIKAREADRENFTALLACTRAELDRASPSGARYLLSIAAGAEQSYLDRINMAEVAEVLDFVNVMTYDFYGGWATSAGHHTNLFDGEQTGESADAAIRRFEAAGVPRNKLLLGGAFYARALKVKGEVRLGAEGVAGGNGGYSYADVLRMADEGQAQLRWDDAAQAPWAVVGGCEFVSFDDPRSLRAKAHYVRSAQLAGLFFWELTGDNGTLLDAMHSGLEGV
ncbi:glycoside hydrolase family 18 protein [Chitinibacteraceae bacterium HSL-7]